MALTPQQRNERTALKRQKAGEEELRLRVRPGTKQALAELMTWAGIEEQGEALTLMIHHIHGLGREGSARFLAAPHHKYVIPENVSAKLQIAYNREAMRICRDE